MMSSMRRAAPAGAIAVWCKLAADHSRQQQVHQQGALLVCDAAQLKHADEYSAGLPAARQLLAHAAVPLAAMELYHRGRNVLL